MSGGSGGFLRRHARALVASLALVGGLGWIMHRGALPLLPPKGTLERVDWSCVALMALLMLVNMLLRFARYQFLIAPIAKISMRRIMAISFIALGLITFLPFRIGEFARPAMLRQKGKLSGWAVTGTVGAERIIDGVVFSGCLLLALSIARPHQPLPDHIGNLQVSAALVPKAALLATLIFGAAFVVMAVFFWWRKMARRITERVLGIFSARIALRVADTVEHLSDGLRFLPDLKVTLPFLGMTLLSLAAHVCAIQVLAVGVNLPALSFAEGTVLVGVLGLGFAMPNAPGFFLTVQLALYAGLAVYVEPAKVVNEGGAFVFLFYVIYIALVILVSVVGVLMEYRYPAEALAVPEPAELDTGGSSN